MRHSLFVALLLWASVCAPGGHAQNVTNYSAMPEPLLLLLREPAVQADLMLSDRQRIQLVALNQRVDGSLLASRNKAPATSRDTFGEVLSQTRQLLGVIFTKKQQNRLRQIKYRVRGISFVLTADVADQLKLSAEQEKQIGGIVQTSRKELRHIQRRVSNGEQTQSDTNQAATEVQLREQRQVLATLSNEQKQALVAMIGPTFDVGQLGKTAFKAPELSGKAAWINSDPLKLANLHGKVVALHFWAFG